MPRKSGLLATSSRSARISAAASGTSTAQRQSRRSGASSSRDIRRFLARNGRPLTPSLFASRSGESARRASRTRADTAAAHGSKMIPESVARRARTARRTRRTQRTAVACERCAPAERTAAPDPFTDSRDNGRGRTRADQLERSAADTARIGGHNEDFHARFCSPR